VTEEQTVTMPNDTERTDDQAFWGEAATKLGDATERETRRLADEEDGSSPDEPQPDQFPDDADETPAAPPEPVVTTPDDPRPAG
jgi:hypothetical protein